MKKILIILISAFVLWKVIGLSIKEFTYQKAIDCIENGDYNQAVELIENMYDYNREEDFLELDDYVIVYLEGESYKESLNIYAYALANLYEQQGESINIIRGTMLSVDDNYNGPFCDEIKKYDEIITDRYFDKLHREEEEERQRHSTMLPYVGMDEKFISDTLAGKYSERKKDSYYLMGSKVYNSEYRWYIGTSYKYRKLTMIVECENHKVDEVKKFYRDELWTEPGQHTLSSLKIVTPERHYPEFKGDMYNVYDYDDPEDFYYDYEDDFDGYEDAEEYFDEAWDN